MQAADKYQLPCLIFGHSSLRFLLLQARSRYARKNVNLRIRGKAETSAGLEPVDATPASQLAPAHCSRRPLQPDSLPARWKARPHLRAINCSKVRRLWVASTKAWAPTTGAPAAPVPASLSQEPGLRWRLWLDEASVEFGRRWNCNCNRRCHMAAKPAFLARVLGLLGLLGEQASVCVCLLVRCARYMCFQLCKCATRQPSQMARLARSLNPSYVRSSLKSCRPPGQSCLAHSLSRRKLSEDSPTDSGSTRFHWASAFRPGFSLSRSLSFERQIGEAAAPRAEIGPKNRTLFTCFELAKPPCNKRLLCEKFPDDGEQPGCSIIRS